MQKRKSYCRESTNDLVLALAVNVNLAAAAVLENCS